jgi:hypothetical protein
MVRSSTRFVSMAIRKRRNLTGLQFPDVRRVAA